MKLQKYTHKTYKQAITFSSNKFIPAPFYLILCFFTQIEGIFSVYQFNSNRFLDHITNSTNLSITFFNLLASILWGTLYYLFSKKIFNFLLFQLSKRFLDFAELFFSCCFTRICSGYFELQNNTQKSTQKQNLKIF